jgi:hypothetical protein
MPQYAVDSRTVENIIGYIKADENSLAVEVLEVKMSMEATQYYNFSYDKFNRCFYEQKLSHVRKDANPNTSIDDMCNLTYEIPTNK